MIDAAVPLEAIDGSASLNTNMVHSEWSNYTNRLYASEWCRLFSSGDGRSTLTWSNRLANLTVTNIYNFYSSGEEVLREHVGTTPDILTAGGLSAVNYLLGVQGLYTWAWQEKTKGRVPYIWPIGFVLGSDHGGWRFSTNYDSFGVHMSPANAGLLSTSQLQTNPFVEFRGFHDPTLDAPLLGTSASAYAQTNRDRILSDAIPARTLPVGANFVTRLGVDRNFNMPDEFKNRWPLSRTTEEELKWHHSDVREVAYTYIYKLFDEIVNDGNLK